MKIKKGLLNKNNNSDGGNYYDSESKSLFCERCNLTKDSVIKTLANLKLYVDSINEKINIIYHKTGKNKKFDNEQYFSNEFFQFYSDIDKLKCGSDVSNQLRILMVFNIIINKKAVKILSDKYDYVLNKQNYYDNVVTTFRNIKNSNKDDVRL